MAGYIFNLKAQNNPNIAFNNLKELIKSGAYSTNMNLPTGHWKTYHEGTFADYMTMKEGDNVYFFSNRKVYGIGTLTNVGFDCKFLNFPEADLPCTPDYSTIAENMILNDSPEHLKNRMICTFTGSPYFFENGIDMDDILASNPEKFKMLRAFWKLSFIKLGDEENQALIDIILKGNEDNLINQKQIFSEHKTIHNSIHSKANSDYQVNSDNILHACSKPNGQINHEMALEVGILDYLSNNKTDIFEDWDYLSHQVIASPFKPIEYMDKMDIFGYKYISGFKTISKYLVIEIKKDGANIDVIHQVMKYVDWVNQEYSGGDYNMIDAYIIAYDFPDSVIEAKREHAKRHFVKGGRNAVSQLWDHLRLIKYHFNQTEKKLYFTEV